MNTRYINKCLHRSLKYAENAIDELIEYKEQGHKSESIIQGLISIINNELNTSEILIKMQKELVKEYEDKHKEQSDSSIYKEIYSEYENNNIETLEMLKEKLIKARQNK